MNKIEELFMNKAIVQPGGWFIFSKKDAIDFVSACEKENIKILGIDGFFIGSVTSNSIQPSLEHSVDFSSQYYVKKTDSIYTDAVEFLRSRDEKMFFEIVCSD